MKILVCAATDKEFQPLVESIFIQGKTSDLSAVQHGKHVLSFLITGVGSMETAVAISTYPDLKSFDFLLQLGIAGSYSNLYPIGSVVEVVDEQPGDMGAELADESFLDVYELGLADKNHFPFSLGKLQNTKTFSDLPKVKGLTVNKVHGTQNSITNIILKYNPDIETMEGAGFFYAALLANKSFCQLRGISNKVEPRNRDNWNIPLALDNVTREVFLLLEKYS